MEIDDRTMATGLKDCLSSTLHKSNIPTYVGIGGGLVAGNAVGKKLESFYNNSVDVGATPDRWIQLIIRTAGRLLTSGTICAVSGSLEDDMKEIAQMGAVGAAGFVVIDIIRELGRDPNVADPSWIDDYLTLQVPARRAVPRGAPRAGVRTPARAAPRASRVRPVALQGRPAMEAAALAPRGDGRPMMETAALTSTSGASF